MIVRELAAKFRASAVEFQRLNPIDVFLLVRRVVDPVESNDVAIQKLIDQNKLQDRFGQVHSCSVVAVGGEWEQCILLVDLRSNITRRAFGDWQEAASHATGLCQAANISPLFNRGHDSIVEFVMALGGELHNRNRTEFADLFKEKEAFKFDLTKGIVTSIEDTPKKSARLMENYATRLGESSAVDARETHVLGDEQATNAAHIDAAEINADVVYLDSQDEASGIIDNRRALSHDDQDILLAMLELNADELTPKTQAVILTAALSKNASARKRKFDNLKAWDYVRSAKAIGMYLSAEGKEKAKEILTRT